MDVPEINLNILNLNKLSLVNNNNATTDEINYDEFSEDDELHPKGWIFDGEPDLGYSSQNSNLSNTSIFHYIGVPELEREEAIKLNDKYSDRLNTDLYEQPQPAPTSRLYLEKSPVRNRKLLSNNLRIKDKSGLANYAPALDQKTRLVLLKLLKQGILAQINGCISNGKEAHVYHAISKSGHEYAVKVYKTSMLELRNRNNDTTIDLKRRQRPVRSSTRQLVRMKADKEMRNLVRLENGGINAPYPVLLKSHVAIMTFIGSNGIPASQLKDVSVSNYESQELYRETVLMMWKMFNKSCLVHTNLSELTILYHAEKLHVVDVLQSVERSHSNAYELLCNDCKNITHYYRQIGVDTLTIKQLFDFIIDSTLEEENVKNRLGQVSQRLQNKQITDGEIFDETFLSIEYIRKIDRRVNDVDGLSYDSSEDESNGEHCSKYSKGKKLKSN